MKKSIITVLLSISMAVGSIGAVPAYAAESSVSEELNNSAADTFNLGDKMIALGAEGTTEQFTISADRSKGFDDYRFDLSSSLIHAYTTDDEGVMDSPEHNVIETNGEYRKLTLDAVTPISEYAWNWINPEKNVIHFDVQGPDVKKVLRREAYDTEVFFGFNSGNISEPVGEMVFAFDGVNSERISRRLNIPDGQVSVNMHLDINYALTDYELEELRQYDSAREFVEAKDFLQSDEIYTYNLGGERSIKKYHGDVAGFCLEMAEEYSAKGYARTVNTTYANCLGIKEDSQWLDDFMEVYEEGHFSYCVKEGDTYWFAMWEYSTPEYASSMYSNEFRYFSDKYFPDLSAEDYQLRRGAGFDEWNYHLYYDFTWKDLCDAWLAEMDNWEGHWIHFLYGAYERAEIGNTDEEPGYYQGNWGGPVFIGGKTVLHFPDQYDYYVKDPGEYTVTATIDGCRGTIVSQFVVNTKPGWVQDENGWRWREENGEFARNKWIEDLFDRYYINDDGYMATGLQKIGNDWYCFNENGLLARGWKMVDGKWYFMDYRGIVQTGWKQVSGKWYYLSPSQNGAMVTGLQEVNDKWYYFNASGEMLTGWQQIDSKWYFFDGSGAMLTGWQQLGGVWYYLAPLDNGAMVTGWQSIDGTWYYFNGSGAMLTGWQQLGGVWYYMNPSGAMVTGWQSIGGVWYYFNEGGAMMTGWQSIGGKWYYFNAGGAMVTGWLQLGGVWYYMNPSGAMVTGRQQINGTWYTFSSSGALL